MTGAPGDFSPRAQGSLQEICESLEIVGKIVSVFTQTFFPGGGVGVGLSLVQKILFSVH